MAGMKLTPEESDTTQVRPTAVTDLISDDVRSVAADSWSIKREYGSTLDDEQRHADATEALSAASYRAASDYSSDKEDQDAEGVSSMLGFQTYLDSAYADEFANSRNLANRDGFPDIKFLVDDILETKLDRKFQLVTDKGSLDAIGLHSDGPIKRIMYWDSISKLVAPVGYWEASGKEEGVKVVEAIYRMGEGAAKGQLSLATSLVPPPLGFLKCWFNAVLDASPSKVSFKMVLFNGQGAFARACNDFLMCVQDPNLANALACKEALAWLKGNGLYNIVL
nr:protein-lysine N-methyltransferase Mettl10-like [Ipomoea batatas]